jgi:predicted naringenin-chalcone synthase
VVTARIVGHGAAFPPAMDHMDAWEQFFEQHYDGNRIAAKVWRSAGIETRHAVADPRKEDLSEWGTGARMRRFVEDALPLGQEAVEAALRDAGVAAADVGLFAVVSCTGYATPGVDILLARDLGMSPDVQRLHIGHMGCYAAIPGLGAAADFVVARGRPAVLLCVELPSLHVQPATDELQQMVAHALFADGVAALVLVPSEGAGPGLDVLDVSARTDPTTLDHMTWDVTDLGFRMGLSPKVPDVLARHARPVVDDLLSAHGLTVPDVGGWAVHPGGRRIVEVVAEQLGLEDKQVQASYDVLRDIGNCSSATVLFVLSRMLETAPPPPGSPVVAMAFGPGLTLYNALLRTSG